MNLLFLSIDCLRYDYVTRGYMPNLWKLKEKGLWFDQAISCGSCTPISFYSIFSGEYACEEVRVKDATHPKVFHMRKSFVEEFQKAGYSTKALHSNPLMYVGGEYGFSRGFDSYEYLDPVSKKIPYVLGDDMTDKALKWIGNQDDKWMLWLHYMDAHPPFLYDHNNLKYVKKLQDLIHQSANYENPTINEEFHSIIINDYVNEVRYVDSQLPKLLDGLEDYLLVLFADHGYQFGEHGRYYMGDVLYDELIHVPLLFYRNDVELEMNQPISQVSLIDLGSILLKYFWLREQEVNVNWMNNDFCQSVAMRDRAERKYWMSSMRTKGYKLIVTDEGESTIYESYNLLNDPQEQKSIKLRVGNESSDSL